MIMSTKKIIVFWRLVTVPGTYAIQVFAYFKDYLIFVVFLFSHGEILKLLNDT